MEFSTEILKVIREASEGHRDVNPAVEEARRKIHALSPALLEEWLAGVETQALQTLVWQYRHQTCQKMRRDNGFYKGPPKVRTSESTTIRDACKTLYDYSIAGNLLGDIRGDQLASVATVEEASVRTHQFNADLCRRLAARVKGDKTVREVVKLPELHTLFRELGRSSSEESPEAG